MTVQRVCNSLPESGTPIDDVLEASKGNAPMVDVSTSECGTIVRLCIRFWWYGRHDLTCRYPPVHNK